jgi:osmotically-inducible protein OsmY
MKRILAVVLLLSGACLQMVMAQNAKPATRDDRIVDQVRMKLAVDQDVKGGAIDVSAKEGVVTLKGRVDTEKGKTRATKLTKKIKGVKDVDNELVVGPPTE